MRLLKKYGKKSDSYARHFAHMLQNFDEVPPSLQRSHISNEILWQAKNPISAMKTFGTHHCTLCNRERLAILKASKQSPDLLINSCNEIFGACRHKAKFHRYIRKDDSPALMSQSDERVEQPKVTTEV